MNQKDHQRNEKRGKEDSVGDEGGERICESSHTPGTHDGPGNERDGKREAGGRMLHLYHPGTMSGRKVKGERILRD